MSGHLRKTKLSEALDLDLTDFSVGEYMRVAAGGTVLEGLAAIPAADVSGLASVATSGDYNDLINTPAAPNTLYSANGTILSGRAVGITDTVNFGGGLFFLDGTNGKIGVNETSPVAKVQIKGDGTTNATVALRVTDAGGAISFQVADDNIAFISNSGGIESALAFGSSKTRVYQSGGNSIGIYSGNTAANAGIAIAGLFAGGLTPTNSARSIDIASRANGTGYRYLRGQDLSGTRSVQIGIMKMTDLSVGTQVKNIDINPTGAGVAPDDVLLRLDSTTQSFLVPKMTTLQKNALDDGGGSPTEGGIVYDTDLQTLNYYNGTSWVSLT